MTNYVEITVTSLLSRSLPSASTYFLYGSSKAKNRTLLCISLRSLSCCSSDWSKLERTDGEGNLLSDNTLRKSVHAIMKELKEKKT